MKQPSLAAPMRRAFAAAALAALAAAGCGKPPEALKADLIAKLEKETGRKAVTTPSGLVYIERAEGKGESPKPTDKVQVRYTGRFLSGKKFDSTDDRGGAPATFGLRSLIKGWVEGIGMMKPGGKAALVIPPELAYGEKGKGEIPGGATLWFEIELVGIGAREQNN